jgi:hypothetical protein
MGIAIYVGMSNDKERHRVAAVSDDEVRQSVLHARQDIKLITFSLFAILVMLGVVADRIR